MRFPIEDKTCSSYLSGMASFGSNRDNGNRQHAGCDLYQPEGTKVYSIADGVIWNSYQEFYLGTGCVEIIHDNMICRYAEISPCVKPGQSIKEGDCIGTIKKCQGLKQAMLHFEMYNEISNKFSLTNRCNKPYMRRKDLINPTQFLEMLRNS